MRGREGAKGGGLFIDQKGEGGSGFIEYRFIFKDVKGFKDNSLTFPCIPPFTFQF